MLDKHDDTTENVTPEYRFHLYEFEAQKPRIKLHLEKNTFTATHAQMLNYASFRRAAFKGTGIVLPETQFDGAPDKTIWQVTVRRALRYPQLHLLSDLTRRINCDQWSDYDEFDKDDLHLPLFTGAVGSPGPTYYSLCRELFSLHPDIEKLTRELEFAEINYQVANDRLIIIDWRDVLEY